MLQSILQKLGIEHTINGLDYPMTRLNTVTDHIRIDEGDGYTGFYAMFFFNKDGKFVGHGIWE